VNCKGYGRKWPWLISGVFLEALTTAMKNLTQDRWYPDEI
jgi:hypothetical protein